MKQVHADYTFVASTKTITLTGLNIAQDQLLLITNATRGIIYYNFASSSHRAVVTAGANTTVVLTDASTTGHADSDQLVIHYDDQAFTQPVSAASLPLPSGASSETTLLSINTKVATSTNQTTANTSLANIDTDLGAQADASASSDTGTFSLISLFKRLLGTKLPDASSGRVPVTLAPTFGSFTNSGAISSAIDCAGYTYLVQHITGGGGGYNRPIQWSNDNTNWFNGGSVFYYSMQGNSGYTDNSWSNLGNILGTNQGLFVIPVVGRYFRIGVGTTGGGAWTHYWYLHSGPFPGIVEDAIGGKNQAAASSDTDNSVGLIGLTKRLLQRITALIPANLTVTSTRLLVDGSGVTQPVSQATAANLNATVVQGTATNLKTQAEAYQGGSAVGSANPLQVTLANTGANATAIKVDGSAVTQPISGTVTANVVGQDEFGSAQPLPFIETDGSSDAQREMAVSATIVDNDGYSIFNSTNGSRGIPIAGRNPSGIDYITAENNRLDTNVKNSVTIGSLPAISGTVTAQGFDAVNELAAPIPLNDGATAVIVQPEGVISTTDAGENFQSGTITLTNNVAQEISHGGGGVNGFNTVVLEINTNAVTFGSNGIVAQAHNQTGAPTDQQIMCPLGVRITHSADSTTGLNPTSLGTVGYVNLEPNTTFAGYYGTKLNAYENDFLNQTANLPATGTRFFIFDLTISRFFLKANFTAGTITVNYRLYRTRHPVFSARKMVVSGEAGGAVRVDGQVSVGGSIYMDGGYLDDTGSIYNAISDALNDTGVSGSGSQLGAATDASATTDTGTFSLISLFKRLLSRITTLIPANLTVTSTRLLVDGSGVTQPVSGTITANAGTGTFSVSDKGATGEATVSSFTSTTSSTLKSSNSSRKLLTIYNEGAGNLHVLYGSGTASTTNYSVKLFSGDYLEIDKYTGQINAIFSSAGTARVTEIT